MLSVFFVLCGSFYSSHGKTTGTFFPNNSTVVNSTRSSFSFAAVVGDSVPVSLTMLSVATNSVVGCFISLGFGVLFSLTLGRTRTEEGVGDSVDSSSATHLLNCFTTTSSFTMDGGSTTLNWVGRVSERRSLHSTSRLMHCTRKFCTINQRRQQYNQLDEEENEEKLHKCSSSQLHPSLVSISTHWITVFSNERVSKTVGSHRTKQINLHLSSVSRKKRSSSGTSSWAKKMRSCSASCNSKALSNPMVSYVTADDVQTIMTLFSST